MRGETIFVAGAYGTGKSTLCAELSKIMQLPYFSAGDLISESNGEQYGANKAVSNKNNNQIVLAEKVQALNARHGKILLAGHFCIFDAANNVELLPDSVFFNLNISQIVLLEADLPVIVNHLLLRDSKVYPEYSLTDLMLKERKQSELIAGKLNCPLSIYKMAFSQNDSANVSELITREDNS